MFEIQLQFMYQKLLNINIFFELNESARKLAHKNRYHCINPKFKKNNKMSFK